ncbi:MAG: hypothetical protein PHT94_02580 [Candidatus Nanoarchaeia archaeon]|nr:hypothetical protein [Candidatus Nanoarchaeia archaeon]
MKIKNIGYLLLFSVIMMSFGLSAAGDWTANVPTTTFNSYDSMKYIQGLVVNMTNNTPITSDDFRIEVRDKADNLFFGKNYTNQVFFNLTFLLNSSAPAGNYKVKVYDTFDSVLLSEKDITVSFASQVYSTSINEKVDYNLDVIKEIDSNSLLETQRANFNNIAGLSIVLDSITPLTGAFVNSQIASGKIKFTNVFYTKNGNSEYNVKYNVTYDSITFQYTKKIVLSVNTLDAIPFLNQATVNLQTNEDNSVTIPINFSIDSNGNVNSWFYDDDGIAGLSYVFSGTDCTGRISGTDFIFTPNENFYGSCIVNLTILDSSYISNPLNMQFNINVLPVDDIPVIVLNQTTYQFYRGFLSPITFTIEDPDTNTFLYKINSVDKGTTGKEIVLTQADVGNSTSVEVEIVHNSTHTVKKAITISWVDKPVVSSFVVDGDFSDISNADIKISRSGVTIDWVNRLDLSTKPIDLSSWIDFSESTSGVNKDVLIHVLSGTILGDNKANISLTGFSSKPIVSCASGKVTEKRFLRDNCSSLVVNYENGIVWFTVDHFSTYRVVSEQMLNSVPELNESATIRVDESLSTYQLKMYDADSDIITVTPVTLPADVSVSSTGLIYGLSNLRVGGTYSFQVNLSDGYETIQRTFSLRRVVSPKLEIEDITVEFSDNTNKKELSDGSSFTANPGESFILKLKLENLYDSSDDEGDIDGVINLIIEEIDDGDDLEFEKDFELKASKSSTYNFDVSLPLDLDEDISEYRVIITVEYEDEDSNSFEDLVAELDLDIERKTTHVVFTELKLSPSTIKCEDRFTISGTIQNLGSRNRNVIVQVASNDLGIDTVFDLVEVEKYGEDDEYSFSKTYDIKNLPEKKYTILGYIYYDNKAITINSLSLTKQACSIDSDDDDDDSDDDDSEYVPVPPIITDGDNENNENNQSGNYGTTILLSVFVLLLIGVLVLLLLPKK